ncbi:XkdQ/YqbQ family protein [Schinkia azotoformans]|uniref:XkdQ/YqbQ family protein n=1 Tax=Schinkia azotoformans TaxID=1454 RepID=UPI002DBE416E|nr:hydrolase [Schinkia azotoformans]MEC1716599.1 hydrolase [Schinkia azotoformans]MEC1739437.1 hydrolase [Schinkia azotoformans]MEC1745493.1 hydrolase [Schinkia azotoformans]MEC1756556.1 hydrolase [Schinkia azotoformans]MEC1765823.1 hydrolase [Schinkia azotoformans]
MEVTIQNGSVVYYPAVEEGITWSTERKGSPGQLNFTVLKDKDLNFQEGNLVMLNVDGQGVFKGFVFTKKRNKGNTITVTAYDQLRYFKNKDTIQYKNITATELVKRIADDFKLNVGELEDTGSKITRIEENKTLFDIVQTALDLTLHNKEKMYVLYDDFGQLTLKNVESMKLDILIDDDTAEDFDYTSSIDGETYNKIKLSYENEKTGKRDIYIAQDSSNINSWGVLQYFETIDEKVNGKAKADALLQLYNRKTRSLTVKRVFGDARVRAGCSVPVHLSLGDMIVKNYMMVEKVKHSFNERDHWMDLILRGGGFIA